jgi:hypothetical protein
MSVIWSWTYFYNLHGNNYLYFKRLTLHLRGDDHNGIVTHGQSREFRMNMKNPAQTGSGCIRFNDWNILVQFVWGGKIGKIVVKTVPYSVNVNVKNTFTSHIDKKKKFDIFLDFFIFIHFHYMKMHRLYSFLQRLTLFLVLCFCIVSDSS